MPVELNWGSAILTAVLTASATLLTGFVSNLWSTDRERTLREELRATHAHYLAVRVVCVLDPFIAACSDVVFDEGLPDETGDMSPRIADPEITLPDDVDSKSIDAGLMYRILNIPNEIKRIEAHVAFIEFHVSGSPDHAETFEARIESYAKLGLETLDLADGLRMRHSIPPFVWGEFDPKANFERALKKVAKHQEEEAARNKRMMPPPLAPRPA